MHNALRKRDLNAPLSKPIQYRKMQVARNVKTLERIGDPDKQLKLKR